MKSRRAHGVRDEKKCLTQMTSMSFNPCYRDPACPTAPKNRPHPNMANIAILATATTLTTLFAHVWWQMTHDNTRR